MLGNWRIAFKTLWERGDSLPENADFEIQRGTAKFTFGGGWLPLPNIFGDDKRRDYNRAITAGGWDMVITDAEYNSEDHSVSVYVDVVGRSEGAPAIAPLVAIVLGIAGIVGGVLLIFLLGKVEAVISLPVFWLIAGTFFLALGVPAIKKIRGP